MPYPHLFISTLWFVSSILAVYPYVIGFKNTQEMKEPFGFLWIFSIISALSCSATVSVVYYIDPTGTNNILDLNNIWHLASLFANLSFASMVFVKQSQTRIAVVETLKNGYKAPFVIGGLMIQGVRAFLSLLTNQLTILASKQKEYMSR